MNVHESICFDVKKYFNSSDPILTFFLALYLAYTPPFYLTFYLAFYFTFYVTFYLAFYLTYILTYILTFYLTYILTFYLASIWQVGKKHLTGIYFFLGGDTIKYKIKAVNFAPNITGVCKHIFGISHQATFWRLQKRYRATVSKLFLDAVDM